MPGRGGAVKQLTDAQRRRIAEIWKAGIDAYERFEGSGMIPPTDSDPWFDIWAATVCEIYEELEVYPNARAAWNALTREQQYESLKNSWLGYDAFIDAYNAKVFRWFRAFTERNRQ